MDPAAFHPALQYFAQDKLKLRVILLEYLPNAETLNCVNYSDTLFPQAIEGMQDIYPKSFLLVRGNTDRLVWADFDVAMTFTDFGPEELARCDYEIALVKGFGEALVRYPFLPILQVLSVLMTRPRDSYRIQNFIKGFIGLQICLTYIPKSRSRGQLDPVLATLS
ncbi:unnamed protein product [Penicillium egyptiacum]|uniref:Aminoglycoside phosphotransferase domain-containing protein n=1 Tax=Penicillium egyptiacum TaxID=1303716 RepID=A0A9W4P0P6_9EURO|nr:unnamed protein product [Penicillium egyptiacum]